MNKEGVIDLEAQLSTSVGCPVGNKAANLATIEVASSDRGQALIDSCLDDVSEYLLICDTESDEGWYALFWKQGKKTVIEKARVVVKKRERGFHDLECRHVGNRSMGEGGVHVLP
jgi:hypothetical protein